jgi:predicted PurR-regulated permease PerM
MGRGLDLSPLVVLISLAFWGWLWGVVGMFLSVPITASIKIVMEHFEGTRVIARLISDVKTEPVRVEKRGGGFLSFLRKRG